MIRVEQKDFRASHRHKDRRPTPAALSPLSSCRVSLSSRPRSLVRHHLHLSLSITTATATATATAAAVASSLSPPPPCSDVGTISTPRTLNSVPTRAGTSPTTPTRTTTPPPTPNCVSSHALPLSLSLSLQRRATNEGRGGDEAMKRPTVRG